MIHCSVVRSLHSWRMCKQFLLYRTKCIHQVVNTNHLVLGRQRHFDGSHLRLHVWLRCLLSLSQRQKLLPRRRALATPTVFLVAFVANAGLETAVDPRVKRSTSSNQCQTTSVLPRDCFGLKFLNPISRLATCWGARHVAKSQLTRLQLRARMCNCHNQSLGTMGVGQNKCALARSDEDEALQVEQHLPAMAVRCSHHKSAEAGAALSAARQVAAVGAGRVQR
mmetsp:Transcript_35562/g.55266  ORF Transcript_35562/g.55266 Transcript_35562/m.55266 type:complete len:223 (-) Transcript_35562:313-981(-)